jgi:hypothetical protein
LIGIGLVCETDKGKAGTIDLCRGLYTIISGQNAVIYRLHSAAYCAMDERVLQYKEFHNPAGSARNAQAKRRQDALERQKQVADFEAT